ncbi:hypothetical protein TNCV_4539851 [Trichonephila clavipes]|nr:hypothetical protein TNCV_4539851 [Trichonephila clavipes]
MFWRCLAGRTPYTSWTNFLSIPKSQSLEVATPETSQNSLFLPAALKEKRTTRSSSLIPSATSERVLCDVFGFNIQCDASVFVFVPLPPLRSIFFETISILSLARRCMEFCIPDELQSYSSDTKEASGGRLNKRCAGRRRALGMGELASGFVNSTSEARRKRGSFLSQSC